MAGGYTVTQTRALSFWQTSLDRNILSSLIAAAVMTLYVDFEEYLTDKWYG